MQKWGCSELSISEASAARGTHRAGSLGSTFTLWGFLVNWRSWCMMAAPKAQKTLGRNGTRSNETEFRAFLPDANDLCDFRCCVVLRVRRTGHLALDAEDASIVLGDFPLWPG